MSNFVKHLTLATSGFLQINFQEDEVIFCSIALLGCEAVLSLNGTQNNKGYSLLNKILKSYVFNYFTDNVIQILIEMTRSNVYVKTANVCKS